MGEVEVPADAYYGASTQRAVLNFPISGLRFPRRFIRALGFDQNLLAVTAQNRISRHHFGIKPRTLRKQPMQDPAMTVRPIHHRSDGKDLARYVQLFRQDGSACDQFG